MFAVPSRPRRIPQVSPSARYAVSARVEIDGRPRFVDDTLVPVINGGPTSDVEVLVKGVP